MTTSKTKKAKKTPPPPKGKALYPSKKELLTDPAMKPWLRAIEDIVASVLARYIDVPAFTYTGRIKRGVRRYRFDVNEERLAEEAKGTRRALLGVLPEAIEHYERVIASTEGKHDHGPGCRCHVYALLKVNAFYVAKVVDGDPNEIAYDNREEFDAFMETRS